MISSQNAFVENDPGVQLLRYASHAREIACPQRLFQRREPEGEPIEVADGLVGVGPKIVGVGTNGRLGEPRRKQGSYLRPITVEIAAELDLEIAKTRAQVRAELRLKCRRRRITQDSGVTERARESR